MQTESKPERNGPTDAAAQEPTWGGSAATAGQPAPDADAAPAEASLADRLDDALAEIARLKEEYLRALAETENVRRRAARDRQEASQYAVTGFARDLLSVADNLQRALQSVDAEARLREPALEGLLNGVAMTERELAAVLDRHGVKRIQAMGSLFDPHVHEAMFEVPDPNAPQGTIVHVLQEGYMLHERTLRPARVGLAKGGLKPGAPPEESGASADAATPPKVDTGAPATEGVGAQTPEEANPPAPEPQPSGTAGIQDGGLYRQGVDGPAGARFDETT